MPGLSLCLTFLTCQRRSIVSIIDVIQLQRLQIGIGMSDVVLGWIQSFLTNQQLSFYGQLSSKQSLLFAVPQAFVPRPLLYFLYTAKLEQVDLAS